MAASDVEIANSALAKVGAEPITSLADNSRRARLINGQYEKIRDKLLRSHPWNFAMKRVTLTPNGNTPTFEYEQEFDLPADYLRGVREEDKTIDWKIEGGKLLANEQTFNLLYISKVTDPTMFDASFDELLSLKLAYEISYPLVQSNTLKRELGEEYKRELRDTRSFDAQEGKPERLEAELFLNSRL